MAKNAKLTIVEVRTVKSVLLLTLIGLIDRQKILFPLARSPQMLSIYLASTSIALCKLPPRSI